MKKQLLSSLFQECSTHWDDNKMPKPQAAQHRSCLRSLLPPSPSSRCFWVWSFYYSTICPVLALARSRLTGRWHFFLVCLCTPAPKAMMNTWWVLYKCLSEWMKNSLQLEKCELSKMWVRNSARWHSSKTVVCVRKAATTTACIWPPGMLEKWYLLMHLLIYAEGIPAECQSIKNKNASIWGLKLLQVRRARALLV